MLNVPDAAGCQIHRGNMLGALGSYLDHGLAKHAMRRLAVPSVEELSTRILETPAGSIRLFDSGGRGKPCVVMVPDGPNLIEHCVPLIRFLSPQVRVVCFDMPGFGYSLPAASYVHSLDQGARLILNVLDSLNIGTTTLAFSCANGFYALAAARLAPDRINSLMLSQTPSLGSMHAWVDRVIPRPLRIPVLGQLVAWTFRRKLVSSWYGMALPSVRHMNYLRDKALDAMGHGACFCLSSVVQGLAREAMPQLADVTTPCTMVWGSSDPSHALTDPASLLHYVPHASIVTFEECGHFPDIEDHARFGALLLNQVMRHS